jgi:hypothetical protein
MFKVGDKVRFVGLGGNPIESYDGSVQPGEVGEIIAIAINNRSFPYRVRFEKTTQTGWLVRGNEIEKVKS